MYICTYKYSIDGTYEYKNRYILCLACIRCGAPGAVKSWVPPLRSSAVSWGPQGKALVADIACRGVQVASEESAWRIMGPSN